MAKIRPQYHFRKTQTGLDAWRVERLIELSADLPIQMINPVEIAELHENHWYSHDSVTPTPLSIIEHAQLIQACDLAYPIILDQQGRVMDGMHRICKAIIDDVVEIPAVRFLVDPKPDYQNCEPQDLPYDE
jgi:hypothetical protein